MLGLAPTLRLVTTREWISLTGPKARRRTTFVFRLPKGALVEFVLVRVAPDCKHIGTFRVRGHAGVNRVRFRGRIGRRVLRPGTYRITARTLPATGRQLVFETRLAIFRGKPRPGEAARAQAADVCPRPLFGFGIFGGGFLWGAGASGAGGDESVLQVERASAAVPRGEDKSEGGVLGTRFGQAADTVKKLHPLLFFLLGAAVALLAIAALPTRVAPNDRFAALLAYRRGTIALAGAMTLVVTMVFYALS